MGFSDVPLAVVVKKQLPWWEQCEAKEWIWSCDDQVKFPLSWRTEMEA